jgi:hypothetical protein
MAVPFSAQTFLALLWRGVLGTSPIASMTPYTCEGFRVQGSGFRVQGSGLMVWVTAVVAVVVVVGSWDSRPSPP